MECYNIYKGKRFNSEIELDDYLIAMEGFKDSDIVYDSATNVLSVTTATLNRIQTLFRNEKLNKQFYKQVGTNIDGLDKIKIVEGSKFIGVTEFLSGLKDNNDKYLFPEFNAENYWAEMFKKWKAGIFTLDEVEFIFKGGKVEALSNDLCEHWRKETVAKWEALAKIGTAIHKVMQMYFKTKYILSNRAMTSTDVTNSMLKYFDKEIKDGHIDATKIKQTVQYAKKLDELLQKDFPQSIYFPEYVIKGTANNIDAALEPMHLIGMIDLLVVDREGGVHIIDYKTSPHDYSIRGDRNDPNPLHGYSSAKINAFKYLMFTYKRILESMGIRTNTTKLFVAPMQLENFAKNETSGKWEFTNIKEYTGIIDELLRDTNEARHILDRVQDVFFLGQPKNVSADDFNKDLEEFMQEVFPKISVEDTSRTMEEVAAMIAAKGSDKPADNGNYYWKPRMDSNVEIKAETLPKLIEKVYSYYKKLPEKKHVRVLDIINKWNEAREGKDVAFGAQSDKIKENSKPDYVDSILRRYLHPSWELLQDTADNPDPASRLLQQLGILRFHNLATGLIDCIMVTSNTPTYKRLILKGRTLITGRYETDIVGKNRDELVLESTYGNIDLMKMMFALNKLPEVFVDGDGNPSKILGRIMVVNPDLGEGLTADNKQILDNFNFLMRNAGEKFRNSNYFSSENKGVQIRVSTNLDLHKNRIMEVCNGLYNPSVSKLWMEINSCVSKLDDIGTNPELIRIELLKIKQKMEKEPSFVGLKSVVRSGLEVSQSDPHVEVYNYLLKAISECDGFAFKQQLQDHSKWFEGNISSIFSKGLTGTYVDNPGTTASEVLNDSTRLVTRAYQNIREDVGRTKDELRKLVQDFKDEVNFGYFKERLGGNMASIYKDMYVIRDGDLYFVDPDTAYNLGGAARKLLKYSIETINRNRYKLETETEEQFQKKMDLWKVNNPEKYFKVPILRGSTQSMLSTRSMLDVIKYKLSRYTPENLRKDFTDLVEGIVDPNERTRMEKSQDLWNMCNIFEVGDADNSNNRKELIKYYSGLDSKEASDEVMIETGLKDLERNLETLVLKHTFAYSQAKHVNNIMPNLKAIMAWLKMQEFVVNPPKGFVKDIEYLQDYIKNKVLGRSINPESYRTAEIAMNKAMGLASKMALAFNPVLLYLNIEHLFKSISLIIRKPDGTSAFTLENMTESMMYTYKDLALFGNTKSKTELLNELYAFNDMDHRVYVERIQSDITGLWHFWSNLAFRMSSRPDYYNRMSIFGAQMRNDGCWEAHTVENGVLKYDWTVDKRFEHFAKGNTKHPEYGKQKAMYYAMAKQLVAEGALNADGTKFTISADPLKPTALPKAYTSDQIEGYKSLSNTLYGYYTTENRSLMQSLGLGALWFLMYTYISGKKNQYLSPSRISLLKMLELYKDENGQLYYVKLDSEGKPTNEITTEVTPVPYMVWKGRFTEGILVTLSLAIKTTVIDSKGDIGKGWATMKNEMFGPDVDQNIRHARIANLLQLVYDIAVFSIVGKLIAGSMNNAFLEYAKDNKVDGFGEGVKQMFLSYGINVLEHSTRDFNFLDSIFGRTLDWNPFALSVLTKTVNNISLSFTGDETLVRLLLKSTSATRQWKPVWDYYIPKPEEEK